MNKIRIVTDSSAEFEPSELVKLGVECVPLILNFGTETFLDGEITDEAFYERLEKAEELPKTAQPSPEVFEALFSSAKEKGEEVARRPHRLRAFGNHAVRPHRHGDGAVFGRLHRGFRIHGGRHADFGAGSGEDARGGRFRAGDL